MAKSAAERKAAQRARQAASGVRKLEIVLDAQEIEMLERNCATRRPGRASYEFGEYIALLIRQDDARVHGRIKSISRKRCGKCGERVPVNSCPCNGDSQCWVTKGWHETKLIVSHVTSRLCMMNLMGFEYCRQLWRLYFAWYYYHNGNYYHGGYDAC